MDTDYRNYLYFALPLSLCRPPFCVLEFGYVFSQLCLLPNYFSSGFQTTELMADVRFHTHVAVYATESHLFYCAMMFKREDPL
jgi:hypothetical protein